MRERVHINLLRRGVLAGIIPTVGTLALAVVSRTPGHDTAGNTAGEDILIDFNQVIELKGPDPENPTPDVIIREVPGLQVVKVYDLEGAGQDLLLENGGTRIRLTNTGTEPGKTYTVEFPSGVVCSLFGEDFAGYAPLEWQFQTAAVAFAWVSASPEGQTDVATDPTPVTLTLNRTIQGGAGQLQFINQGTGLAEPGVVASNPQFSGSSFSVDATGLQAGTSYRISAPAGYFTDTDGNPSPAYLSAVFTTAANDPEGDFSDDFSNDFD